MFTCSLIKNKIIVFKVLKVILSVLSLDGVVVERHCFTGTVLGLKIHPVMYFDIVKVKNESNRMGIINIWRF